MTSRGTVRFVLGADYHLGDLLWLTAVIGEYRRVRQPDSVCVSLPESPVAAILESNPLIEQLERRALGAGSTAAGVATETYELRMLPIAMEMLRQTPHRLPWLYYRDLWFEPRGQWLATYLRLGPMQSHKPVLALNSEDFDTANLLPSPYVVLAPNIGSYKIPAFGHLWRGIKGWENWKWAELVRRLRGLGYEVVSLGAGNQKPVAGTRPVMGVPIRQAAGVIARASALVSVESGLWFVAAALDVPFVVAPWWLPRSVDWPKPMGVRYRLVRRSNATVSQVVTALAEMGVGVVPA